SQPHPELVDTWQAFHDWFARISTDADVGWTSADVLSHLSGEVMATNAGIALVMVGTNDVFGNVSLTDFRRNMAKIVRTLEDLGVVPVLSTLPDIVYGGGQYQVDPYNQVIADVAARFRVPLWNLWRTTHQLPNEGVDALGTHLAVSPNGGGSLWSA